MVGLHVVLLKNSPAKLRRMRVPAARYSRLLYILLTIGLQTSLGRGGKSRAV
jgi:hypothetical protein